MSERTPMTLAPGPRGLPHYGSFHAFDREPLGFLVKAWKRHGDIVHFKLGPEHVYLLSHPDHVKHVLTDQAPNYPKPSGPPSPLTGNGLFKSEGEFWKRQRSMVQPGFHRERLAGWVDALAAGAQDLLERWEPLARSGTPFDVAEEMARLACSLMHRLVFTEPLDDTLYEATRRLVYFLGHPESGLRRVVPFLSKRREQFEAALRTLDTRVYARIADRRRGVSPGGDDLLDFLVAARDRTTGEGMDDTQLRDEAVNLYAAGYEATAAAWAWAFHLLDRHPEARERLRAEALEVLGPERLPTAEDVPRLRWATQVFEESLRLFAPAWVLDRQAREADRIGGFDIPAGAIILMSPYILHRHPALWERPESFEPERFGPERSGGRSRFAFLPFGAGQRICVGNHLAMLKGPLVLAMVARRYRLDVRRRTAEPRKHAAITLTPAEGISVVATRLSASAPAETARVAAR